MFKYCNINPRQNRVGDCVVRAIAAALGKSWEETYIELCLQGYLMCDLPSSNSVWNAYLKNKGYKREFIRDDCPECYTVSDFSAEYPEGTYIIGTGTHAVAVIDGDIIDNWDSSGETPIYYYYIQEVEK